MGPSGEHHAFHRSHRSSSTSSFYPPTRSPASPDSCSRIRTSWDQEAADFFKQVCFFLNMLVFQSGCFFCDAIIHVLEPFKRYWKPEECPPKALGKVSSHHYLMQY